MEEREKAHIPLPDSTRVGHARCAPTKRYRERQDRKTPPTSSRNEGVEIERRPHVDVQKCERKRERKKETLPSNAPVRTWRESREKRKRKKKAETWHSHRKNFSSFRNDSARLDTFDYKPRHCACTHPQRYSQMEISLQRECSQKEERRSLSVSIHRQIPPCIFT